MLFIVGTGGVGKSSVLRMFRLVCREQLHVPVALVSGHDSKSVVDILRRLADDLEQAGLSLTRFHKKLREFERIQVKLVQQQQDSRKAAVRLTAKAAKAAGAVLATMTGAAATAGPVLGALGSDAVAEWLSLGLSESDRELYLDSDDRLTEVFLADLRETTATAGRTVVLLDTYEQLLVLNAWVGRLVRDLPDSVFVVIAGRVTPASDPRLAWTDIWPAWMLRSKVEELVPMHDHDARLLVSRYYRSVRGVDPPAEQIESIGRFSGGLPLAVTTAVDLSASWGYAARMFDDVKPDVVRHLVDQVIMGDDLPTEQRELFEAAATLRFFNAEAMGYLADADVVRRHFRGLERSPIVKTGHRGLFLNDVIRDLVNEHLQFNTPTRASELHRRAADYYQHRLAQSEQQGTSIAADQQLLILELIFHRHRASVPTGLQTLRQAFDTAYGHRDIPFCRQLISDVRAYAHDAGTLNRLTYYEALSAIYTDPTHETARGLLEGLTRAALDRDLRADTLESLATLLWYYSLRQLGNTATADRLYEECLALRSQEPVDVIGQTRVLTWLGILHQRTEGKGESYFRRALEAVETRGSSFSYLSAWLQRELSIALRMQGQFDKALPLIVQSTESFTYLELDAEAGHSVLNLGMLRVLTGELNLAEESFRRAQQLFSKSGHPRSYELAWPLHGLGDAAMGKLDYVAARDAYLQAGRAWERDQFGMGVIEGALAQVALFTGDVDLALKHADQSVLLRKAVDDTFGLGWVLAVRGAALLEHGHIDRSMLSFQDGLHCMETYGSDYGQSLIKLGLCALHAHSNDLAAFDKVGAGVGGTTCPYYEHRARLHSLRGLLHARMSRIPEAVADVTEALTDASKFNEWCLQRTVQDICRGLIQTSQSGGDLTVLRLIVDQLHRSTGQSAFADLVTRWD